MEWSALPDGGDMTSLLLSTGAGLVLWWKGFLNRAACETPGAGGLAQSSILLVNTHSPWIADWMPAPEDRRHAERWK